MRMAGGSVTEGTAERERKKMGGGEDMVATGNITVFF